MLNYEEMKELIECAGYEPYDGYSGRFMYGQQCLGMVCDDPVGAILDLIEQAVNDGDDMDELREIIATLRNYRSDSLGLSTIVYWPSIIDTNPDPDDGADDPE